jgi:hypothetical protein
MTQLWSQLTPSSFQEVFEFYSNYYKVLYSEVASTNQIPGELLFEIGAAFDHLSTHWTEKLTEQDTVKEVFRHIKRACLDIFKLKVKEARRQYDALCKIDTSNLDEGEFDRSLHMLFNQIKTEAINARIKESGSRNSDISETFSLWEGVYLKCDQLEKEYFLNPKLDWAKRKYQKSFWKYVTWGIVIGVFSTLLAVVLLKLITPGF